jgi:hypothetical protein
MKTASSHPTFLPWKNQNGWAWIRQVILIALCAWSALLSQAQDVLFSENFDSMGPAGVKLPGAWTAGYLGALGTQNRLAIEPYAGNALAITAMPLVVSDGSALPSPNVGTVLNMGTTGSSDRALGNYPRTNPSGDQIMQAAVVNNLGRDVTEITLSYAGEQWRQSQGTAALKPEKLKVLYSLTSPTNGFTYLGASFDFTAPQDGPADAGRDGNNSTNRAVITGTIKLPSPLANGQTLYIRWHDWNDDATSDHFLAIDDVSITTPKPPGPPDQLKLRTAINLAGDLSIAGSSMYNPRLFDGNIYVAQINTPAFGRYPSGSITPSLAADNTSIPLEHRMVAPFRGPNKSIYMLAAAGATTTTFSRYDFNGGNRVDVEVPGAAQTGDSFDWIDDNTIIYTTYNPSANRKRLSLARVTANPFAVAADTRWNANGFVTTSVSTRIRNVRAGDLHSGYAFYGDAGQNDNPNFYAINLATGAETRLGNAGTLTGAGSFGLWTVVERGGKLYVQTTDNGIQVYNLTNPTTLGSLDRTFTKEDLDTVTGYTGQYWGFDVSTDRKTLILAGQGLVYELSLAAPPDVLFTENFDSMGPTGVTLPAGWTAGHLGAVGTQNRLVMEPYAGNGQAITVMPLGVSDGSPADPNVGTVFNFGATGGADRALGNYPRTNPSGDHIMQVAVTNKLGRAVNEIALTYTGEQWRQSQGTAELKPEKLRVLYSVTSPTTGFTYLGTSFDFIAPHDDPADSPLDGNDPANRAVITGTIKLPSPLANGQTLYIRWHDWNDNSAYDHFLAIDDVSITAPKATATATPPKFNAVSRQGDNLVISWTGTGTLEQANAVTGPWATALSQSNPQNVPATSGLRFYRLKQ